MKSTTNKLFLTALTVFIIKTGGAFFTLLTYILLSQFLGASNIGSYYLSLSVISIAATLSLFGMSNPIVKFSARSYQKNNLKKIKDLYKFTTTIAILSSGLLSILVYIAAPFISKIIFHNSILINNIQLMSLAIIPLNLLMIHSSLLKGVQKPNNATVVESLAMPVSMAILLLFFSTSITLFHASIIYIVSVFFALTIGYLYWKNIVFKKANHYVTDSFQGKEFIKTSIPLYSVSIMTLIMGLSDTVMLGFWYTSDVVGIYGSALKIASISTMFLVVANTILAPKFSILFAESTHIQLNELVVKSTQIMSLLSLFFLLIYLFIPEILLGLFGDEFINGKYTLIILSVGQFFVLGTGSVATLLMMTGHEKFHKNNTVFSAILNIALNFTLIPIYGPEGAAFATSFSLALKNIIAMQYARKHVNINFFTKH